MNTKPHVFILFIYHFVIRFDEILATKMLSVVLRGTLTCEMHHTSCIYMYVPTKVTNLFHYQFICWILFKQKCICFTIRLSNGWDKHLFPRTILKVNKKLCMCEKNLYAMHRQRCRLHSIISKTWHDTLKSNYFMFGEIHIFFLFDFISMM